MREIKFRVWDDKLKIFNYFDIYSSYGRIPQDLKDNIQQFSGLLDENGKEIFEGDIAKIKIEFNEYVIRKVIFLNGFFGYYRGEDIFPYLLGPYCEVSEVIGNIFETPELATK